MLAPQHLQDLRLVKAKHCCAVVSKSSPPARGDHTHPLSHPPNPQSAIHQPRLHPSSFQPGTHHRRLKPPPLLPQHLQRLARVLRALHQLPRPLVSHVLQDRPRLVARRRILRHVELPVVPQAALRRVVRRLVFGRAGGGLRGDLFEKGEGADRGLDRGFVEEGDDVQGLRLEGGSEA